MEKDAMKTAVSSERWFRSPLFVLAVLAVLGALIYSNSFDCGFHFDDVRSILINDSIKSPLHLKAVWDFWPTRFVTYLTVAANHALGQERVFGYHLFNLAVHVAASFLVWWFVLLTFSTPALRKEAVASRAGLLGFFSALVFAAHPIQTQAVTYIIQRATSLAAFFYLAALCLYAQARLREDQARLREDQAGLREDQAGLREESGRETYSFFYAGSLTAVVLAMFTKEIAITLPLMVLLYEACFFKGPKGIPWKRVGPFLATFVLIPVTLVLSRSVDLGQIRRVTEGATPFTSLEYFSTQLRVLVTYARLVFVPLRQNLDYDYPILQTPWEPAALAGLLFLAAVLALAWRLRRRHRVLSFGIFWFFLTLLPESSFLPIRDVIYEHRLYLPMVGFSVFLVCGLYTLFRGRHLGLWMSMLLALVCAYGTLTYRRNPVWKDDFSLWQDITGKSPYKVRSFSDRGNAYAMQGDFQRALAEYDTAIANGLAKGAGRTDLPVSSFAYRRATEARLGLTAAYFNRGIVYKRMKEFDRAIASFTSAIEIEPGLPMAHYHRGLVYSMKGDKERALADLAREIQINPEFAAAPVARAMVRQETGED